MKTAVVMTLMLFVGCSSNKQGPPESVPLLPAERTVAFSATPSKDLFRRIGVGPEIARTHMAFLILNQVGHIQSTETFPSGYLLENAFPSEDTSIARMRSYITHRVTILFDKDHFAGPAVPM